MTNGPTTLGVYRYDVENKRYAIFRDGTFVTSCEIDLVQGDKTMLSMLQGTATFLWVNSITWKTSPTGSVLLVDNCDELNNWSGDIATPGESSHSGWSDSVTDDAPLGTFRGRDGSGGGKDIVRDEPEGAEYVEISFTWDEGTVYVGLGLHTIGDVVHNYDGDQEGGFGVMNLDTPYDISFPFCTAPADYVVPVAVGRPPFYYYPPMESLRDLFR